MGNWTTVNIIGSCPESELPKLKEFVNKYKYTDDWDAFHCLSNTGGICGIGDWANESINAIGNLAERDYSYASVAEELNKVALLCPTADIKVHVGGDYESLDCIKTVHLSNGIVEVKDPEIPTLKEMDEATMHRNLMKAIMK